MSEWVGTRAEREWLAELRGIRQELRRLNEGREAWADVVDVIATRLARTEEVLAEPGNADNDFMRGYREALIHVGRELEAKRDALAKKT